MVKKALVLSMLLLANKDGNISAQMENMRTDTTVAVFQEQTQEVNGFGAYEDGDGGQTSPNGESVNNTSNTSQTSANPYPRKAYTFDKDGSWVCGDYHYLYRLELVGRNPGASEDGRFLVLTNDPKMSFERVSTSFTSSNPADQLDIKNTVVVEAGWYR